MLLKKLEEKARNDFNQESSLLRKNLLDAHIKTEQLEHKVAEKEGTINGLSEEIIHLSKEWEAAKILNDKQKESVDALVTRNNTLENQLSHFRDANQEKKLKIDNKVVLYIIFIFLDIYQKRFYKRKQSLLKGFQSPFSLSLLAEIHELRKGLIS